MGPCILRAFAPGRTEVAGNHTDHEGGHVIAAAIDRGIEAEVAAVETGGSSPRVVRVESDGFDPVVVDLGAEGPFEPRATERGTTASLVRGVLAGLHAAGVALGGFVARLSSGLPAGGGLSSSAAFELLVGTVANELFADGRLGGVELARIGQRAEADYFGKPCGLMDQLAIACGGVSAFDFADPEEPQVEAIDCDLAGMGLAVVLVDTGCDHSRYTDEYSAVPAEMQQVARLCGARRLGDVAEGAVLARAGQIRRELGDRALLRAMHFYREERLVAARVDALRAGDAARFLALTRASGASSGMFLQNVSAPGREQPAMVALALAESLIDGLATRACPTDGAAVARGAAVACGECPADGAAALRGECLADGAAALRGAARIHGGGFGGSIQAFVPLGEVDEFVAGMDGLLGAGSCLRVEVGGPGAGRRGNRIEG